MRLVLPAATKESFVCKGKSVTGQEDVLFTVMLLLMVGCKVSLVLHPQTVQVQKCTSVLTSIKKMINNILKFLGQSVYYLTLNSNKNAPKARTVQVWQFSDLKH